jgi:hypothetical protein
MSRPIAYNASGPLSGSIRGGSVNYTVDSGNRDYTTFASKKWVPSADGAAPIVFVTDTYTQGFELNPSLAVPLFYSCNGTGSAAIIYTANRIPGSPGNYSDANVALNDLITARGYFILESNDPFEGVDADSLVLDVDASKMSSYPQVGTNWRDLSGQGNTGALINGPTWNSSGSFDFDGSDDYVQYSTTLAAGLSQFTWNANILFDAIQPSFAAPYYQLWIDENALWIAQYANAVGIDTQQGTSPTWFDGNGGGATGAQIGSGQLTTGRWYNFTWTFNSIGNGGISGQVKGYLNSTINATVNTNQTGVIKTGTSNTQIATRGGSQYFNGQIKDVKFYSKQLSESDIKQNYFGAPIVTDGLVFAVDANNIVSYPKSGTSTYNLTGSGATGTLTNGTSFNITNGGSFMFDGTNDYISFPNDTNLDSQAITMESWSNVNSLFQDGFLFEKGTVNTQYSNFFNSDGTFYFRTMGLSVTGLTFYAPSYISPNTWNHIVCTYGNGIKIIYVNGVQITQQTGLTGTIPTNTAGLFIGQHGSGGYLLNGKIANSKVYNRALTAAEVLQNYQAEQYRFETPAGPVTNGLLLYWDAGNLDSYPGTGTTIYDLSGNGNNGTLVNRVGYNQTNGGVLITDGIDDYIYCNTPNLTSTNFTEMGAARYISFVRPGGTYPGGRMINANSTNWLMGHWGNTVDNYFAEGTITGINGSISDLNWRIYAGNGDISGDVYSFYMNNSLYASNGGGSAGPNGVMIGKYPLSNLENANGAFSFLLIYNRILTTAEMTQNYNYFKGRFGL